MKRFTKINEGFVCEVCGQENKPAEKTCRNHCCRCLCSKHVDKNPGDRRELCGGILEPVEVELSGGVMCALIFRCQQCGVKRKNKIAPDDDREQLFLLSATSPTRLDTSEKRNRKD